MSYFDLGGPTPQMSWRWNWRPFFLILSLETFSLGLWIMMDPEEICIELGFLFLTVGCNISLGEKEDEHGE
jgi:hypothetical protein